MQFFAIGIHRRPRNLRDVLVHAGIPYMTGDEVANPNHIPPIIPVVTIDNGTREVTVTQPRLTQTPITDHFKPSEGSSQVREPSLITNTPGNCQRGVFPSVMTQNADTVQNLIKVDILSAQLLAQNTDAWRKSHADALTLYIASHAKDANCNM